MNEVSSKLPGTFSGMRYEYGSRNIVTPSEVVEPTDGDFVAITCALVHTFGSCFNILNDHPICLTNMNFSLSTKTKMFLNLPNFGPIYLYTGS